MQPLIAFSKEHPELSVDAALQSLVNHYNQNPPQNPMMNMPGGGGNTTPGQIQGAFPPGGLNNQTRMMQSSPGMLNGVLPNGILPNGGNAHTPSPHQANMAPPMVPQGSQQGSVTSSNTSPNVSTKRRRSTAAGVKGEEETGAKVKQSPRMASGNAKRMKGS